MRVKEVRYLEDYKLQLLFSDRSIKIVDLRNLIFKNGGVFVPLRNLDYFRKVVLDESALSICWPNGVDICPDVLFEMGVEKSIKKRASSKLSKTPRKRISPNSLLSK